MIVNRCVRRCWPVTGPQAVLRRQVDSAVQTRHPTRKDGEEFRAVVRRVRSHCPEQLSALLTGAAAAMRRAQSRAITAGAPRA